MGIKRHVLCGYCGARVYEYGSDDPPPSEHEAAIAAFTAHDAQCDRNPLVARIRELEAERDRLREAAEERWDMVEMPGEMSLRDMHQLAQEGCRFFYLRPRKEPTR